MKIRKDRKIVTQALSLGLHTMAELAAYIRILESGSARPSLPGAQA